MRKYKTPKIPGTKRATQRPMPPTFSVKLAFHPVKMRVVSKRTRKMSSTSSANKVPLGNGRTEKRKIGVIFFTNNRILWGDLLEHGFPLARISV